VATLGLFHAAAITLVRIADAIAGRSPVPARAEAPDACVPRVAIACDAVLARARQVSAAGSPRGRTAPLVAFARELLDDLDDHLVALHPVRDAAAFALAARLHRELAWIEAAIPRERSRPDRSRIPPPSTWVTENPRAEPGIERGARDGATAPARVINASRGVT